MVSITHKCTILLSNIRLHCFIQAYRVIQPKFILVTVLIAAVFIEVTRLYLGYLGNLTEKVPELAGFWLLTVLLQFPLQCFLFLNSDLILLPLERAANAVMVALIVAELMTGFIALKKITRHQAKKFHLMQLQIREE